MFYPLEIDDPKRRPLRIRPPLPLTATPCLCCLIATAAALLRLANDVHLPAFGPRCRFGQYVLPSNEPGSSIMPGE